MIYRMMLVIGLACSGFGCAATNDLLYPEAPPFELTTFDVKALPTTLIVGDDGRIRVRETGFNPAFDHAKWLRKRIERQREKPTRRTWHRRSEAASRAMPGALEDALDRQSDDLNTLLRDLKRVGPTNSAARRKAVNGRPCSGLEVRRVARS